MRLWGLVRNSLTSKAVLMYFAVVLMIEFSVIRAWNFSVMLSVSKLGIVFDARDINCSL